MNVRCPECQTVFRVDPDRIPVAGVRARCARCSAVFALSRSGVAAARPAAAMAAAAPAAPQPAPPPVAPPVRPPAPRPVPSAAPTAPRPTPSAAPPAASRPAATAPATPAPAARGSFLKQDPNTRAQRLARALVSDIVAYNREKRDQMLAAGTLKNEFREEIRKSWEEYVAQVGLELARSTPYFRQALNEILAKGESVF